MSSPEEVTTETIHVLIGRVLKDLPAVGKGSTAPASMGNYSFRGIDDTLNALNPILSKHGVFFLPTVEKRRDSDRQTGTGKSLWMVSLRVRYRFYGPAGDSVDCVVEGEGSDSGDKATQKAMTAAMKYMLFQVFAISTKEVGELDAERHEVPESTPRPRQASRQESRDRPAPAPTSSGPRLSERDDLAARLIAHGRKKGTVIEPSFLADKEIPELRTLWNDVAAGKYEGQTLGAPEPVRGASVEPGARMGTRVMALLPEDLQVVVREKRGVFAEGWLAEFMSKKGRMAPTAEDLAEIERECR